MLARFKAAGLLLPTLSALVALAVLVGLGTWQLERKGWKEGLLARIGARVKADPVSLTQALDVWRTTGDIEYLHVRLNGRFMPGREGHVYAIDPELGPGFHLYAPLVTDDGRLTLVNRGFVPQRLKDASLSLAGEIGGEVAVTGLARAPRERGWFIPASDPARNIFFWPDYQNLIAHVWPTQKDFTPVPFFIDADPSADAPASFPRGGVTRLTLPNRHLEYAVTWYGLALTLIGVYFVFAAGRWRQVQPA